MADLRRRGADRGEPFAFEKLSLQPGFFRDVANKCSYEPLDRLRFP